MSRAWLTFDLGVQGDYEGLYAWLDEREAEECGDGVATFMMRRGEDDIDLLKSIRKTVTLGSRARLYLVRRGEGDRYAGTFLHGHRKAAPWAGASGEPVEDDEEEE